MHSVCWISSYIQMLLGPDDVDIFAIVDYLTEEWDILKREDSQVLLLDVITEYETGLHIESSLTEDGTYIGTMFQVGLNLLQDIYLGMRG